MLSFLFQRPWLKTFSKALLVVRVKEFPPAKQLLKEIVLFNLNIDRMRQWRIPISYLSFNVIIYNYSKDVRVLFQILTFLFLMWFTYILREHSFMNLSEKLLPVFHLSAFNWDPKATWTFWLKYSGKLLWLLNRVVGSSRNPTKEGKIETLSFFAFYNISITILVLGACHNTEAHIYSVKIRNAYKRWVFLVPLPPSGTANSFSFQQGNGTPTQTLIILILSFTRSDCMGTLLCTTLYRTPTQACPHSGHRSDNTQVDREMVFMNDELELFKFFCMFFFFYCGVLIFLYCPSRSMQTFPKSEVLSVEAKAIFAWYFIRDLNYLLIWWNINNCALHSVTSLVTMIEKHTHKNQYRLSCYLVDFVSSSPGIILLNLNGHIKLNFTWGTI